MVNKAPMVREGFRTETALWDFKADCPRTGKGSEAAWAELAKDVLAFHNSKGGLIFFGVNDNFEYVGATTRLDSKLVNDRLRHYIGDRVWVDYARPYVQNSQRYLGVALVPPRGYAVERFKSDAPEVDGERLFLAGESALRKEDSCVRLSPDEADDLERTTGFPVVGKTYAVDELYYRILAPEYHSFVHRPRLCDAVRHALTDRRTSVCSLVGQGGVGKTALATWAVLEAYCNKAFSAVISVTAKDRELTGHGIVSVAPTLQSYELLLNDILDVTGNPDLKPAKLPERASAVRSILEGSNALLYVDNLETVDDARIIEFLDTLPEGTRAMVTSRKQKVRVAVHPVDIGGLNEEEVVAFVRGLSELPGFKAAADFTPDQVSEINRHCDGLPLAIRWVLSRTTSPSEALRVARDIRSSSSTGEQLLEFSFRRIFDSLSGSEQDTMRVLSLFQQPLPTETVIAGTRLPVLDVDCALGTLIADGLVTRLFDPKLNDYCYMLKPLTRAFVAGDLTRYPETEKAMRGRLTDWYEARDIPDPERRVAAREMRQGLRGGEEALLDLAVGASRRGDVEQAEKLFEQACRRNPKSWRAWREHAEFVRHEKQETGRALEYYTHAARYAPRAGRERALVFRELGMLLRDSGQPDATDRAIENLEEARRCDSDDVVATTALAAMHKRKGASLRVIELLVPLQRHRDPKTREIANTILSEVYRQRGDLIKAAECTARMG